MCTAANLDSFAVVCDNGTKFIWGYPYELTAPHSRREGSGRFHVKGKSDRALFSDFSEDLLCDIVLPAFFDL